MAYEAEAFVLVRLPPQVHAQGSREWHDHEFWVRVGDASLDKAGDEVSDHSTKQTADASDRTWRRCSPDDDRLIERLRLDGASLSQIGRALGRRRSTIYSRLMRLAEQAEGELS